MNRKSRTALPVSPVDSPLRHLPLVELLVDTKTELLELALRSGLKVFTAMLDEDRTAICGPRYAHEPDRPASRAGSARSEVVLGGRKVAIQRPRVRTAGGEVALPTFQTMAATEMVEARSPGLNSASSPFSWASAIASACASSIDSCAAANTRLQSHSPRTTCAERVFTAAHEAAVAPRWL